MTYPARAEIKHPPCLRQRSGIVFAEEGDSVLIDMRDEAGGGVEICVWGFVLPAEVTGGVGESGMAWLIRRGRELGGERGRGSHGGEEGGDGQ